MGKMVPMHIGISAKVLAGTWVQPVGGSAERELSHSGVTWVREASKGDKASRR